MEWRRQRQYKFGHSDDERSKNVTANFSVPPPTCSAYDLLPDGVIDLADINVVVFNSIFLGVPYDARFDLTPDGVVDIADIFAVAVHYGESCTAP